MNDAMNTATVPTATVDSKTAFKEKLEKLMLMKEMGALSDEEFAAAKANLLKEI